MHINYEKKGFTLIELLAVILVLGIIALIAVPIVLNVIKEATKGALKDSAYGIIDATDLYFAQNQSNLPHKTVFTIENNKLTSEEKIDYKGKVILYSDGTSAVCIDNGDYAAIKRTDETEVTLYAGTCGEENSTGDGFDILSDIEEMTERLQDLQDEVDRLRGQNSTLQESTTELTSQLSICNDERTALNIRISELETQIITLNNKISDLNTQIESLKSQISTLNGQIANLTTQNTNLSNQVTTLTNQVATLTSQKTTLENQVSSLTNQVTDLTNQVNSLSAQASKKPVLKKVLLGSWNKSWGNRGDDWYGVVTVSATSISGYQSFTADNFVVDFTKLTGGGPDSGSGNVTKTYDASTGTLTVSGTLNRTTSGSTGWGGVSASTGNIYVVYAANE